LWIFAGEQKIDNELCCDIMFVNNIQRQNINELLQEGGQAASHHKRQPHNVLRHLPSFTAASHHLRQPLIIRGSLLWVAAKK